MIGLKLMHMLNRKIENQSEKVFEGISRGRKKSLENWFKDKWKQLENMANVLESFEKERKKLQEELKIRLKEYEDFCEFFVLDDEGKVIVSTCEKHMGLDMKHLPGYKSGKENKKLMYGPYEDMKTLDIDLSKKKFADEVTLMFSIPYRNFNGDRRILFGRVLNDDMSNVIQDEDTHVYKDSGDNYLLWLKLIGIYFLERLFQEADSKIVLLLKEII